jgi:hypothetical protein
VRESRGQASERVYDVAGAVTVTAALVVLVYALVEAPQTGWGDGQTIVLLIASASLVVIFARRSVAAVGLAMTGAGGLLLTRVSVDGSYLGDIFVGQLVFGPGLGATGAAASVATLAGVAEQDSGLASALNNAAFQIGGAVGTAVVTRRLRRRPGQVTGQPLPTVGRVPA